MVDNDDDLVMEEEGPEETEELPEDLLEPLGETYVDEAPAPSGVPAEEDTAPYMVMIVLTTAAYVGALGIVLWWLRDYIGGA
jgi:hypothetical protein